MSSTGPYDPGSDSSAGGGEPTSIASRRIAVVGTSGAGKTTLAQSIADALEIPWIELDGLHWGLDWTERPESQLREALDQATRQDAWVCDGNYGIVRDLIWTRAETLVWLDYSFARVFAQVFRRTVRRAWSREELFSGNRETWRQSFASKDSILWWVITTWRRRRREYPALLARPEYAHLRVHRFRHPREAQRWLASLPPID